MQTHFVATFQEIDRLYKAIRDEVHAKGNAGNHEHTITCKLLMQRHGEAVHECIACLGHSPIEAARKQTLIRWTHLVLCGE